jgi:hypothetical protein
VHRVATRRGGGWSFHKTSCHHLFI